MQAGGRELQHAAAVAALLCLCLVAGAQSSGEAGGECLAESA